MIMKLMRFRREQTLVTLSAITTAMVVIAVLMILLASPSSYVTFLGQRLLLVAGAFGLAGIAITIFLAITDRIEHH
jgi:hypothetical protein